LRPNAPSMTLNNSLYDGEADARTGVVLSFVQPLEYPEELMSITHIEADAIILDVVGSHCRIVPIAAADLDDRLFTTHGVLNSVGEQIDPYLFKQGRVGGAWRQSAQAKLDVSPFPVVVKFIPTFAHELIEWDGLLLERLAAQTRKCEQIVDELSH